MDLEARVARLERAARRWRALAVGLLVVGGIAGATRPAPQHIEARSLAIEDADGFARRGTRDGAMGVRPAW